MNPRERRRRGNAGYPVVPGSGITDLGDPLIDTEEVRAIVGELPHDHDPVFEAGAGAVSGDPLLEAMLTEAGPSRVLRVADAYRLTQDHLRALVEAVEAVAVLVKGPVPDPVPDGWWDDIPERVAQLRRRDELAARLSKLDLEARVRDARREGFRRVDGIVAGLVAALRPAVEALDAIEDDDRGD